MNLGIGVVIGLKEIWAHKFRSFLTMLGVILGVASLLSMFSLTAGIAKGMREYMQAVGGLERVDVINQDVPEDQQLIADISPGRTLDDAEAIHRSAPMIARVTPTSELNGCAITRGAETFRATVVGCWPDYVEINKHVIAHGRNISQLDLEEGNRVCIVGTNIVQRLWPERPGALPLGETILFGGRPFSIVGIFQYYESEEMKRKRETEEQQAQAPAEPKKGHGGRSGSKSSRSTSSSSSSYSSSRSSSRSSSSHSAGFYDRKNSTIIIPINTMFWEFKSTNVVGGVDQGPNRKLDGLAVQVADVGFFHEAVEQVGELLKQTHRGVEDYSFSTREEWFESIEKSVRSTRISGGIIAGISLLVGGIGIMNIMLASITERIREIGVRRAVGAKGRDIFMQIVVESAVLGIIGGVFGLVASLGIMQLLIAISPEENKPVIEMSAVLISFGFAVIIGILSGLYPALSASRIEPMEALRYG